HSFTLLAPTFILDAPAPTESYTPSLHDALPIFDGGGLHAGQAVRPPGGRAGHVHGQQVRAAGTQLVDGALREHPAVADDADAEGDRKSTRLNSSHVKISYAVFCLKKKIMY